MGMTSHFSHPIPDLSAVESVARLAGAEIMRFYESGITPEFKKDGSMVTPADRASEKIIRDGLAQIAPQIPFVGEESVEAGIVPDISGGTFWCVDPLDGTRNFVERNGQFAVLIGLVMKGIPVMGVLFQPTENWLCAGAVGLGAHSAVNDNRRTLSSLPTKRAPSTAIVEHKFRSRDRVKSYVKKMTPKFPGITLIDSKTVWPLCDLAMGHGDVCLAFSQSYEWDTAAVHGILHSVGGGIIAPAGKKLAYGKRDIKFLNPDIAGCADHLADQLPEF